jgi:LysM repeat protein
VRITSLLAIIVLLVAAAYACGGGGDGDGPVDLSAVPTATLPNPLPEVVIVGEAAGPTGNGGQQTYTVVSGDTLSDIADRFGVSVDDLVAINNLTDPTDLFVDQVLTIPASDNSTTPTIQGPAPTATAAPPEPTEPAPGPTEPSGGQTYTVQEGDIPETIAAQFGITADALMAANGITDPTSLQIGQVLIIPAP